MDNCAHGVAAAMEREAYASARGDPDNPAARHALNSSVLFTEIATTFAMYAKAV